MATIAQSDTMNDSNQRHQRTGRGPSLAGRPAETRPLSFLSWLSLAALLVLPVLAIRSSGWDWRWVAAFGLTMNVVTYAVYAHDKCASKKGAWRVPEAHLHLLELAGGWPGAWIAQGRLRHKTAKKSYQFVFGLIVLAHQVVAYDAAQNWQLFHTLRSKWPEKDPAERRREEMRRLSRPSREDRHG